MTADNTIADVGNEARAHWLAERPDRDQPSKTEAADPRAIDQPYCHDCACRHGADDPWCVMSEREVESDARPSCGHTTKPCTDQRTWCPQCLTPPCSRHLKHLHLADPWESDLPPGGCA